VTPALLTALILALAAAPAGPAAASDTEWVVAVLPSGEELGLELAVDPASRARGYMYREEVGSNEGMLFVFERSERHGMWMKNCNVALDILWLDENLRVLEVAANRQPCTPGEFCPTASPLRPARYVLELAAGSAERQGLRPGSRVILLSELPQP
jgi:uncharacterized membrane protein (UPF0127 family)